MSEFQKLTREDIEYFSRLLPGRVFTGDNAVDFRNAGKI